MRASTPKYTLPSCTDRELTTNRRKDFFFMVNFHCRSVQNPAAPEFSST